MIEFKKGDLVLCKKNCHSFIDGKKTNRSLFNKYKLYEIKRSSYWDYKSNVIVYDIYTNSNSIVSFYDFTDNSFHDIKFNEFFYTKQEIRKLKIEKINKI